MTHASCHHKIYGLSCAQFDALKARADGRCEICRERFEVVPQIDHDDRRGAKHVRGLVCSRCNSRLTFVDNGFRPPTPEEQAYLDSAWFWTGLPADKIEPPRPRPAYRHHSWANTIVNATAGEHD